MIGAPATPEPAPAPPGRRGASRWSAGRIPIRATGWLRSRLPAGRNWANDALLAAVVIAISLGASYASSGWHRAHGTAGLAGGHGATTVAGYLLLAAGGAALVARRQYPVIVLGVTLAAALLAASLGHATVVWLPLIVAFFTAVQKRRRAAAVASLVIGYLVSCWPACSRCCPLPSWPARPVSAGSPSSGSGTRNCCGGRARTGCAWPGTCTMWWRTTYR